MDFVALLASVAIVGSLTNIVVFVTLAAFWRHFVPFLDKLDLALELLGRVRDIEVEQRNVRAAIVAQTAVLQQVLDKAEAVKDDE